jgi:hypothetical protein
MWCCVEITNSCEHFRTHTFVNKRTVDCYRMKYISASTGYTTMAGCEV